MPVGGVAVAVKGLGERGRSFSTSSFEAAGGHRDSDIEINPNPSLAAICYWQTQKQADRKGDHGEGRKKHWLIDSHWFEAAVASVALVNAVQIGMSVDLTVGTWPIIWKVTEHIFTLVFVTEMLLKLYIVRCQYFYDAWNLMDFALVMMAVLDNWILSWALSEAGALGDLTMFRIFRLARVARVFRMVRFLRELVALIEALVYSIKTMAWSYVLLLMLVYVYALLCVEFIGSSDGYPAKAEDEQSLLELTEDWNNYQFFGTVSRSMYSLFSIITLSEFSGITRPISEKQPACVLLLISFTCLSAFGIMNVIVGQMVQQALDVSHGLMQAKEEALMNKKTIEVQKIRRYLDEMDANHDADISMEELRKSVMQNEELAQLLVQIDLPPSITINEVFTLIDASGDGSVSPAEFEHSLLRLIDCTHFHHLCLMQIQLHELKRLMVKIAHTHLVNVNDEQLKISNSADGGLSEKSLPSSQTSSVSQGTFQDCITRSMLEVKEEISKMQEHIVTKLDSKMQEQVVSKLDMLLNCVQLNGVCKELDSGRVLDILESLPPSTAGSVFCSEDKIEQHSMADKKGWELLPNSAVAERRVPEPKDNMAWMDNHSNAPVAPSLPAPVCGPLPPNLLCMPRKSSQSSGSQPQGQCWPQSEACRDVRVGVRVKGRKEASHGVEGIARDDPSAQISPLDQDSHTNHHEV